MNGAHLFGRILFAIVTTVVLGITLLFMLFASAEMGHQAYQIMNDFYGVAVLIGIGCVWYRTFKPVQTFCLTLGTLLPWLFLVLIFFLTFIAGVSTSSRIQSRAKEFDPQSATIAGTASRQLPKRRRRFSMSSAPWKGESSPNISNMRIYTFFANIYSVISIPMLALFLLMVMQLLHPGSVDSLHLNGLPIGFVPVWAFSSLFLAPIFAIKEWNLKTHSESAYSGIRLFIFIAIILTILVEVPAIGMLSQLH